ncbi:MAG: hypothetical protein AAF226_11935, partial [Verrucomicrobiota bacterium]
MAISPNLSRLQQGGYNEPFSGKVNNGNGFEVTKKAVSTWSFSRLLIVNMSKWKKVRHKLEYLALSTLAGSIPLLTRKAAQRLGVGLGNLGYKFDKRGKSISLANLKMVFGDEKSPEELETIARESYQYFARTVIDQLWSSRLTEENYQNYMKIEASDMAAIEAARETGAIWVTPHYSNFEWISLIMGFRGYKFTVVAQDFKNPALTAIYRKNREVSGHEVIPQQRALIKLLRALKNKGNAAFLTDLT